MSQKLKKKNQNELEIFGMTDIKNLQNNIIIDKKYIISTFWLNKSSI